MYLRIFFLIWLVYTLQSRFQSYVHCISSEPYYVDSDPFGSILYTAFSSQQQEISNIPSYANLQKPFWIFYPQRIDEKEEQWFPLLAMKEQNENHHCIFVNLDGSLTSFLQKYEEYMGSPTRIECIERKEDWLNLWTRIYGH
jgi:hypothetical protein